MIGKEKKNNRVGRRPKTGKIKGKKRRKGKTSLNVTRPWLMYGQVQCRGC